jgi:hypothetical protein
VERAKPNGRDPLVYLREVLTRIADHPINRIDEVLPLNVAQGGEHQEQSGPCPGCLSAALPAGLSARTPA